MLDMLKGYVASSRSLNCSARLTQRPVWPSWGIIVLLLLRFLMCRPRAFRSAPRTRAVHLERPRRSPYIEALKTVDRSISLSLPVLTDRVRRETETTLADGGRAESAALLIRTGYINKIEAFDLLFPILQHPKWE